MAHFEKFSRTTIGHMTRHYERAKDSNGEYIRFGNQNIDTERTHWNYNLAPKREGTQLDFIHQRLSEVHCMNRKDVNVMCSWCVTVPKEVDYDYQPDFFEVAYDFLEKRFGKENVVSAYVHNDETTPHLHFAFIPVVYDEKKDRYKVSAKECVTRKDLEKFHTEFQQYIDNQFCARYGIDANVLNGATDNGNLTIKGLQCKDATELADKITLKLCDLTDSLKEAHSLADDEIRYQAEFCKQDDIKPLYDRFKADKQKAEKEQVGVLDTQVEELIENYYPDL